MKEKGKGSDREMKRWRRRKAGIPQSETQERDGKLKITVGDI